MRLLLRRTTWEEAEGMRRPRGWGRAWEDHALCTTVLAPVPLNLLFGWVRRAWHWAALGPGLSEWDAALVKMRQQERVNRRLNGALSRQREEWLPVVTQYNVLCELLHVDPRTLEDLPGPSPYYDAEEEATRRSRDGLVELLRKIRRRVQP